MKTKYNPFTDSLANSVINLVRIANHENISDPSENPNAVSVPIPLTSSEPLMYVALHILGHPIKAMKMAVLQELVLD